MKFAAFKSRAMLACLVTSLGLVACGKVDLPPSFHATDITGASYGQGFTLTDGTGQMRSLADYSGKVVMVFFGFIQCPDVCPTALSRAVEVKELLGADGERLQVVFISVDPERDTPEIVNAYLSAFDPSFVGLNTSVEALPELAKAFRVFYRKVESGASYTMDHTATSYVFDTEGRLRLAVPHTLEAPQLAEDLRRLLAKPDGEAQ